MADLRPLGKTSDRVSQLRRLTGRRSARFADGLFVIEGPELVVEALHSDLDLHYVAVADRDAGHALVADALERGVDVFTLADATFDSVATTRTPQPGLAVAALPHRPLVDVAAQASLLFVLDGVSDPGNAGTIVRLAEAVGADGVVFANAVDPFNPKTVRSTAGSVCRVPIVIDDDPRAGLRDAGFRLVGADGAGVPYDEVDPHGKVALVLGSEAHGLSIDCDEYVALPMAGEVESLNVAIAASALAFDLVRRRV